MRSKKDEILQNAKRMAEDEKRRRETIIADKPLPNLRSRMPLGCLIIILGVIALIAWLIKKYGPGL